MSSVILLYFELEYSARIFDIFFESFRSYNEEVHIRNCSFMYVDSVLSSAYHDALFGLLFHTAIIFRASMCDASILVDKFFQVIHETIYV